MRILVVCAILAAAAVADEANFTPSCHGELEEMSNVHSPTTSAPYEALKHTHATMVVEPSYSGPHLAENVTKEFMDSLIAFYEKGGRLHPKYTIRLLLQAYDLLKSLNTLHDIEIPADGKLTVCGDVHGQFYDVVNLFTINGLPSETNPYLFNGDFVDRGSFSVEVILTFIGYRLLYPNHFFMTRGNHESVLMNLHYGFAGEVNAKYESQIADFFTDVFNWLPLGHLINKKILVVHGGLPSTDGVTLDDIRAIDRNRQPPEEGIMADLLWSDPSPRPGRRYGRWWMWGPDVTEAFFLDNGLELLIRSHEYHDEGYDIAHDGKVITIFSAPLYMGYYSNKGAFITLRSDLKPQFTTFDGARAVGASV